MNHHRIYAGLLSLALPIVLAAGCASAGSADSASEPTPISRPSVDTPTYSTAADLVAAATAGGYTCEDPITDKIESDYTPDQKICGNDNFLVYSTNTDAETTMSNIQSNAKWQWPTLRAENWIIVLYEDTSVATQLQNILGGAVYTPEAFTKAQADKKATEKAAEEAAAKEAAKKAAEEEKAKERAKERAKEKINNADTVSERALAKIIKSPDNHVGEMLVIYGQVSQFDSATGTDTFRADVANRNTMSYGYFDGENAILTGKESKLDDLVEDDVFKATVTVMGSQSYDTTLGGSTTVPMLKVNKISVIN